MTVRLMVNASMDPAPATRSTLLKTARRLFIKYRQFPGQCQRKAKYHGFCSCFSEGHRYEFFFFSWQKKLLFVLCL